jgi:hypothetical protein
VSSAAGRHPSDAERAEAARPVLDELVAAAGAGDAGRVAACLDEDAVWLGPAGTAAGREEAARRLLAAARGGDWEPPRQHGAHALLRWTGAAGAAGGVVVEVRRGRVVLVAGL